MSEDRRKSFSDDVQPIRTSSPSERAKEFWKLNSDVGDVVAYSVEQKLARAAQNPGQPISFTPQELSTLRNSFAQGQAVERLKESQVHEDARAADTVRRQTRMKL